MARYSGVRALGCSNVKLMGVVEAKIQTVEEIYGLVWAAVANRRAIAASYHRLPRLFCPHRLGRNKEGELRVLCYQYGGESESGLEPAGSPANWRCIVLEKLRRVKLLDDGWHTAPNHSRPASCVVKSDIDAEDYPEHDPQKGH
jgi:hypothetical protein